MPHPARAPVVVGIDGFTGIGIGDGDRLRRSCAERWNSSPYYAFSDIDVSDFACVERSTMQLLGEQVLVKRLKPWQERYPGRKGAYRRCLVMRRLT